MEFPDWLELVGEVVVVVGLLAQLSPRLLPRSADKRDGAAAGIAQDRNVAMGVGQPIVDREIVGEPPRVGERAALKILIAVTERRRVLEGIRYVQWRASQGGTVEIENAVGVGRALDVAKIQRQSGDVVVLVPLQRRTHLVVRAL